MVQRYNPLPQRASKSQNMLFRKTFSLLAGLIFSATTLAQQLPVPPQLAAKSWLLIDMASDQMLTSEKPDDRLEPASLTKLMTAYLTFWPCTKRRWLWSNPCQSRKRPGKPAAPRCSSRSTHRFPLMT